jgi:hypothetical protein
MTAFAPRNAKRVNRREHERAEVDAPARLVDGTIVLAGRIENISDGGASFVTPQLDPELEVGAHVTLVAPGAGDDGADVERRGHVIRTDVLFGAAGEERTYALGFEAASGEGAAPR